MSLVLLMQLLWLKQNETDSFLVVRQSSNLSLFEKLPSVIMRFVKKCTIAS